LKIHLSFCILVGFVILSPPTFFVFVFFLLFSGSPTWYQTTT